MRRPILLILLCLLGGAILSVAIAWGCLWFKPMPGEVGRPFYRDRHGQYWIGGTETGPGWSVAYVFVATGLTDAGRAMTKPLPHWFDPVSVTGDDDVWAGVAGGWPLRCLVAHCHGLDDSDAHIARTGVFHTGSGPQAVKWGRWSGGIDLGDDTIGFVVDPQVLPYHVKPLGLLINTLLLGGLLSVPLIALAARGPIRKLRGKCPSCGYDMRASTGACPECGWPGS